MKHQTRQLWSGTCVAKPSPHHQIILSDLWSSEILCSVEQYCLTRISEQPISLTFKGREIQKTEHKTTEVTCLNLIFWDYVHRLFPGKEVPNVVDHLDRVILTKVTLHLLRYVPGNRSSQRIITGKQLLKNYKLPTWLKNNTWTKPQIKNHYKKKSHELSVIRTQPQ